MEAYARKIKMCALSAGSGLLAGSASALFRSLLDHARSYRYSHMQIIWALPVAGFAIGWIYYKFGKDTDPGNSLILDEIHDPKKTIPLRMAPFVLMGTIATILFGGSAGREGTAVQMGASLSDNLGRLFKVNPKERRALLVAGMGAGFSSAIGAPLAGIIFGFEVLNVGRFQIFAVLECVIASLVAYYTVSLWQVAHTQFRAPEIPILDAQLVFAVFGAAITFGVFALIFSRITRGVSAFFKKQIPYPPLRPLIGGVLIVILYYFEASYRYVGLGLEVIQESLTSAVAVGDPFLKTAFTALTLGSGFKGGEFIPLVFIGTTTGNLLGALFGVSSQFLAALGFAAVFGAAANTPLACAVMGTEIFGLSYAPYFLVVCYLSYYFSGHQGIYASQRVVRNKHRYFRKFFSRS